MQLTNHFPQAVVPDGVRVCVVGLGYVGSVSAAVLGSRGHSVIGVDVNPAKVDVFNRGRPPVFEHGLEELLRSAVCAGRVRATTDLREGIRQSDVSLICVNTPRTADGSLEMSHVRAVAQEIADVVCELKQPHAVGIRSTVAPGTNEEIRAYYRSRSAGRHDLGVVSNPEFLREGSAIADFEHPPYTLLASKEEWALDRFRALYAGLSADVLVTTVGTAELIKFVSNSFHALKVAFANEVGTICSRYAVDAVELMEAFRRDTKLNASGAYLTPGFAYGGSCLPKDLSALIALGERAGEGVPLLRSIPVSNANQVDRLVQLVRARGVRRVGIIGVAFKDRTDDLRNSPILDAVDALLADGRCVNVHDDCVNPDALLGVNADTFNTVLARKGVTIFTELRQLLCASDLVIVNKRSATFAAEAVGAKPVIDLVGNPSTPHCLGYIGFNR